MASDSYGNQWYQPVAGLNSIGSYQVSGIPFATGSLAITTDAMEIQFPSVTKSIVVRNHTTENLRVGFSENGINGSNYFMLGNNESFAGDLRVSKIFLRGDTTSTIVTVVAGLTGIPSNNLAANWSGSLGVG